MRPLMACLLATLTVLAAWTTVVGLGTLQGWWRRPLAPRGDAAAFARAADRMVEAESRGNIAVALIEDGQVSHERFASVGAPVGRDTLFQVASLSKWVTALGVMTLVDSGRVDLDAPVETYLKRWRLPVSEFDNRQVTIRRLLSHTAGLTDGLGYGGFAPGEPVQPLAESLSKAADASPGRDGVVKVGVQPGSEWRYSGGGYALLQLMIEDVTGEPFAAYMKRAVLKPLGMDSSSFEPPGTQAARLAESFDEAGRSSPLRHFSATSAAGLHTSVADLAKLIQAHRPGPGGGAIGRGVLSPAALTEMRRPHGRQYGAEIWGLGVMLYAPNNSGSYIIGHDGDNEPTINTSARLDPDSGDGIVVLESGTPLLATRLAGEWVFWRTGHVDTLTVLMEARQTLTLLVAGWVAILAMGLIAGWRLWRRRLTTPARPA